MTITLKPKTEQRLRVLAEQQHVSVEAFVEILVERESANQSVPLVATRVKARNLVELFKDSPLKGIAFERDKSPLRDASL